MKSRLLFLLLAVTALLVAGCGDSGSSSTGGPGADPATVVPASAPVYIEAVVRPDGAVGDGARDALKKLLRTDDPSKKITDLLNRGLAKDGTTWDDIKPWLGKRIGGYLSGFTGGKPTGAAVIAITDKGKAQDTLGKAAEKNHKGNLSKSTYKGVELTADADGTAMAFLDEFAVIGTADGVKQVIDTAKGGRPLADVADYTAARTAVAADDALGTVYLEPQGLLDVIGQASSSASSTSNMLANPQALTVVRQAFAKAGRAAGVSLHADGGAVRLSGAAIGAPAGTSGTAAADAVAALPADAWLALGFGDLGKSLTGAVSQIGQLAKLGNSAGPDVGGILKRFEAKTGVDLQRDFLSWMGDGAIYVRGRSLADIGGALTIKTKNPAKSRKAVAIIARGIRSAGGQVRAARVQGYDTAVEVRSAKVPVSLFIAANAERFSLGVNPQALTDLLSPSAKLGDSSTYGNAKKALGGSLQPVFILDTPTIVGLIEGFGVGTNPSYQKVKPYLDLLGPLAVGTAHDGDVAKFSLALALR